MEPSREAIAVRITRLNRQILGKVTSGVNKINKKTIDREALLDALTILYDECNDDPVKKSDELVRAFVDKYRSTLAELRRTRVCLSDFEVLQTIGRGYFGEVHMVRERETGDVYAVKTVRKEHARRREAGAAEDERDVLAASSNVWIPRLQYAFQDTSSLYLVMELCSGGDLAGLMSRRTHPLSERDAAFYVAEVAHALKTLHGMGFVHRDVKPHNILLDRCGHVKLGDFGSCVRLSEEGSSRAPVGTVDYVAPEQLAAAECAARHSVCLQYCRGIVTTAISACDYWSLGVVAFELVTLKKPFSSGDGDSMAQILGNIQRYERTPNPSPPFEEPPLGPSSAWRSLVSGLLCVKPNKRFTYLDTLQHPALAHIAPHTIRDQAPPWVPCLRGPEDTSYFSVAPRDRPAPSAASFRTRMPFAGQLPFIGYSYVALEDNEDSSTGFNASHDLTAIDLATFKSAEKLAAMRSREITSLQNKLAAAEASASVAAERTRREADAEAERLRARLQAEITALSLQNKRLERQVEVEKEERMALHRRNQELTAGIEERNNVEMRHAQAAASAIKAERDSLRDDVIRLEARIEELQAECNRALSTVDTARAQHQHYKDIIEHVHELQHRRLTEMNVRPIDTIAKERAIRRQTLSGGEAESREAGARLAAAEANLARETRAKELLDKRVATLEDDNNSLHNELDAAKRELAVATRELATSKESLGERQRTANASSEELKAVQMKLAQERMRVSTLLAQVQELERGMEESVQRETALEEQGARTEMRLNERLHEAEERAAAALREDSRHREKVNTLEQLVRQLEREVSAMEARGCTGCGRGIAGTNAGLGTSAGNNAGTSAMDTSPNKNYAHSDTESVSDAAHAQLSLLKEQLEKAEGQLQARAEEMATLRQEARAANLAKWRKEREFNDLQIETKSAARDLKRLEERLASAIESRNAAEQKASALQREIATLRPQYEQASKELATVKEQLQRLQKAHETAQAEVDRSRNDIRKLKSELQYSEKRRLHAEEQEGLSSRERAQLRDELHETRIHNTELVQNNKALQEACSLLEEQLTDLEKLADFHEVKNKDLEGDMQRMRSELETCRSRLSQAEKQASERSAAALYAANQHEEAREQARYSNCQVQLLQDRLENRESRVAELESVVGELEGQRAAQEAALGAAARRTRDLQEECATLRTRAHHHHGHALQLQAALADAQEELAAAREAAEAATAWWRTRETKADATLRQQTKLIDFLQTKVEEAGRKKCSLNKLFGRSGRRTAASPPLRRANRELREEVERLRAKLAASGGDLDYPPSTPKREKPKPVANGNVKNIQTSEEMKGDSLLVVWPDDTRERMRAGFNDGKLLLFSGDREIHGRILSQDAKNLPQNEANRAFVVKLDNCVRGPEAAIVCSNIPERAQWMSRLRPPPAPPSGYFPALLVRRDTLPVTALYVAPNAVAIGCSDGLHSLRGAVHLEWESDVSPPRGRDRDASVTCLCLCENARPLFVCGGTLATSGLLALGSALRRAPNLQPAVGITRVSLPDATPPHLIRALSGDTTDGPCAAVACGRRVFLLRFDASASQFNIARSLTVDRPPNSLLLTTRALYIAGEKPLKINLPSSALEAFAIDEPMIAAAARKHSPPKAILLIRDDPVEILICYSELGVFVDEYGKRTRNDDPKWSSTIHGWEFVNPFLYVVGEEKVTIIYINEEAYKAPPCTCDTTSLASTASECYMPETFSLKLEQPALIGTAPNGIIIRSKIDDEYNVSIVEGMAAFRSIGASVESLETISDSKGSSTDLAQSITDLSPHDASLESVEATTGFLADIRKRARQLRTKNRNEHPSDEVIKEILRTEVGLKRPSKCRKSPATISEFDSDSTESEETAESVKSTADVCAELFTRQVRFE